MPNFMNRLHQEISDNENISIIEIIKLATIFTKHLKVPNFLLDILTDRMDRIQLN